MESVEIKLHKREFEEHKKSFLQAWKGNSPNEDPEYDSYSILPTLDVDECKFEDDTLIFESSMHYAGDHIGYVQFKIPITMDLAADIIDAQVKKYNKIKTILEATK
jgi:hypothetical protein